MLIFLPIWLSGWTLGGIFAMLSVISGKAGNGLLFMLVWLCFWLVGEVFALYTFLWGAFGYEIITTHHGNLSIKRSILGYGLSKDFTIAKVSNLRASGFFGTMMSWNYNMAYWGITGGTVAFDYDGTTHRFGISLDEKDAQQLAENLQNRLTL